MSFEIYILYGRNCAFNIIKLCRYIIISYALKNINIIQLYAGKLNSINHNNVPVN